MLDLYKAAKKDGLDAWMKNKRDGRRKGVALICMVGVRKVS